MNILQKFFRDPPHNIDHLLGAVDRLLMNEMNAMLLQEFKMEQMIQALEQMYPTKSPGPDGMLALFYQKNWHIVRNSVFNAILSSLNCCHMLKKINYTRIALLPKTKSPQKTTKYRPISLCNDMY